ncbi:uncharacterized protein LOC105848438 [Hydra vulgaris]|uniref:uncharacterized protein LOC105848438 n=1 Tax=Hydra vulgaris TaxID=6087 RepID=UPI0032EA1C36
MSTWGVDLWDNRDNIEKHTLNGIEFLDKCSGFIKDRIRIEQEYAKNLRRLVKQYQFRKKEELPLYSTIVIKEDGIDTKTVVLTYWVNAVEEYGCYETCQAMLNILTEDENDDRPVSNMLNPKERVPSPNLHALKCTTFGSSSPIQLDVPLISPWKKSKVGCIIQLRSNEDFQQSLDLELNHFNKNPTSFNIGDGGVSLKEMTNKQFQYAMLMKLDLLQQNQLKIMERLDNIETKPKSCTTDEGSIITIPHRDIRCFNEEEETLKASSSAVKNKQRIRQYKINAFLNAAIWNICTIVIYEQKK